MGERVRVVGRPRVTNRGRIAIGNRVALRSTVIPIQLEALSGGSIEIGDRTFINYGVSIAAHEAIRIGKDCLLGAQVMILDNNQHDLTMRRKLPPSQPVTLGDNVWLGHRVIVLPGVTIGHDAVVGAGAVVTKDIPPRSIAVGNPARVVKSF